MCELRSIHIDPNCAYSMDAIDPDQFRFKCQVWKGLKLFPDYIKYALHVEISVIWIPTINSNADKNDAD